MHDHHQVFPHRLFLLGVAGLTLAGAFAQAAAAQSPGELSVVRQVRDLPPKQAASEKPVRLRGVVTALSGWNFSFFLQDASAGISVNREGPVPEVHSGDRVEVVGVSDAGKFAPIVKAQRVSVLGKSDMPVARVADADELATGAFDSQWASVRGFVRTATIKKVWDHDVLVLELDLGGGTVVTANVRAYSGDAWQHLAGSLVSFRGVCGTIFNDRRQFVGARFFVSDLKDITILHAGPTDLFDRPATPIASVASFSSGKSKFAPIKVMGTITSVQGDDRLYVQSGADGLLVHTSAHAAIGRGAVAEIVGYARNGDYSPSLEGAVLRSAGSDGKVLEPVRVDASKVIVEKDGFPSAPYDSLLVRVTGTLTQILPEPDDDILLFRSGAVFFGARLPKTPGNPTLPEIGSVLAVTGICFTRLDSAHEPHGFRILLEAPSDIQVLKQASWWTAEHAKDVVIGMTVALILMAALLTFYRRESALRQLSHSDPLTGVHNRRGFVLLAEQQWRLARRNKEPMLLFYIDVDRFKEINDSLGHKQGDIALQTVANVLRDSFRSSDIVGRLGGDEFAVVACKAASRTALEERLEHVLAQTNSRIENHFQLALSVGALECDASLEELTVEDLLTRADALMYKQKASHRSSGSTAAQVATAQTA